MARPAPLPENAEIMYTQAEEVIKRFGNPYRVAEIIQRRPSVIYRWTYPKSRGGTNGIIPAPALQELIKAARREGVLLTDECLIPRPVVHELPDDVDTIHLPKKDIFI